MEIKEAAARGARLLDDIKPGWYKLIDLGQLDMGNCYRCILGQVYGDYDRAIGLWPEAADLTTVLPIEMILPNDRIDFAVDHGFSLPSHYPWEGLADAWAAEVKHRWEIGVL